MTETIWVCNSLAAAHRVIQHPVFILLIHMQFLRTNPIIMSLQKSHAHRLISLYSFQTPTSILVVSLLNSFSFRLHASTCCNSNAHPAAVPSLPLCLFSSLLPLSLRCFRFLSLYMDSEDTQRVIPDYLAKCGWLLSANE